jgi:uncharacterized membrane protein
MFARAELATLLAPSASAKTVALFVLSMLSAISAISCPSAIFGVFALSILYGFPMPFVSPGSARIWRLIKLDPTVAARL